MLNIQIDNSELEKSIKQDINISVKQLDEGKGVLLSKAMESIRSKYE